jgi:hypothetical protein
VYLDEPEVAHLKQLRLLSDIQEKKAHTNPSWNAQVEFRILR